MPGHKSDEQRTDFDKRHRIARLKRWPEKFSYIRHDHLVRSVTGDDAYDAPQHKFLKAFGYERKFYIEELTKIDKAKRKKEKKK